MRTGCALLVCLFTGCHGGAASDVEDAGVGGLADPDLGSAASGGDDGGAAWPPLPPTPATPELWYWHHSFLSPNASDEPAASEALIDRAAAAGYHGLALWDSMLDLVGPSGFDGSKLATVIAYAHGRGLDVLAAGPPYGWSNDILRSNPNLAEGQCVIGTQFKVQGGVLVPQIRCRRCKTATSKRGRSAGSRRATRAPVSTPPSRTRARARRCCTAAATAWRASARR